MKTMPPITQFAVSAVIITYNEAKNLARTISQLTWCDEIVVVDSFSTDGTDRMARELGCKVIQRAFESYGEQKSFAISKSRNDWVLCVDADEYMTSDLVEEIKQEIQHIENIQAFAFPSNLVFRNQRFRFGRESKRMVVKLFNRNTCCVSSDRVHERIIVNGKIKNLEGRLLHYSYRDITQFFVKFDRYTEWCAEKYYLEGKRKWRPVILTSLPYYFIRYYLADRNILNGMNGFYWSALMSYYHFVKYLKLEDLVKTDHAISYATIKSKRFLFHPGASHLRVTELGGLVRYKKK
jgi:glycosyltransferase involved in cell wall biosynthesis